MLQKIRKASDSKIFKLCLVVLVISFALGVADFIKGGSQGDFVTFSGIEPISYEDFVNEKSAEIKRIQKNEGVSYSEEQIAELGIDNQIISNMIQGKLLRFLAKKYDIDFSDSAIADMIKELPIFRDENKSFNIDRFKSYLRMNNITEEQYANQVYDYLATNMIMSSFIGNAHISKIRIDNIIDYMSEARNVDIASISLKNSTPVTDTNISETDILAFYEENKENYKTPEVRDICFVKIDNSFIKEKNKISDGDIGKFYEENKDEFAGKKLNKVKDEIRERIYKQKLDEQILDLSKTLEDDVAGGDRLEEIASKYGLKRICEKELTFENIETRSNGLFSNFIPQISAMSDKEVSYPLDLPENKGIILFEIAKLIPENIQSFDYVKKLVASDYQDFIHRQSMIEKIQNLSSRITGSEFNKSVVDAGMALNINKSYIRSELAENNTSSPEMMLAIFDSAIDKVAGPFIWDDRIYIFVVRKILSDSKTKSKLTKSSSDTIANKIRDGIIEETLYYAQEQSKMKINTQVQKLTAQN